MLNIKKIQAQEILDSRGDPTVKVWVTLNSGARGEAAVPSGASTGRHEAWELRDKDRQRFNGKGVLKAVANVNGPLARLLQGYPIANLRKIDAAMIKLDGTRNKRKLGANAILGASLACASAGAYGAGMPLYKWLRKIYQLPASGLRLPTPLMNVFNGGRHADTNLDFQEYLLLPQGLRTFHEQIRAGSEIFQKLAEVLQRAGKDTDVGNEGGYAPQVTSNEDPLRYILKAVRQAGYAPGKDIAFGIDVAASEFYDAQRKKYYLKLSKKWFTADELSKMYIHLFTKYPLLSLEDPFAEDDWESWVEFNAKCKMQNAKLLIIGDDLYTTNVQRLKKGLALSASNAILIKPNQIGTLSETLETIALAQKHNLTVVISHRSGETLDTTIADLAVAVQAEYIKAGAPCRGERVAKYNRLLEIEKELRK